MWTVHKYLSTFEGVHVNDVWLVASILGKLEKNCLTKFISDYLNKPSWYLSFRGQILFLSIFSVSHSFALSDKSHNGLQMDTLDLKCYFWCLCTCHLELVFPVSFHIYHVTISFSLKVAQIAAQNWIVLWTDLYHKDNFFYHFFLGN